jgi:hypothetical protein
MADFSFVLLILLSEGVDCAGKEANYEADGEKDKIFELKNAPEKMKKSLLEAGEREK